MNTDAIPVEQYLGGDYDAPKHVVVSLACYIGHMPGKSRPVSMDPEREGVKP